LTRKGNANLVNDSIEPNSATVFQKRALYDRVHDRVTGKKNYSLLIGEGHQVGKNKALRDAGHDTRLNVTENGAGTGCT